MVGTKTLADVLTVARVFLGFYLIWLGWQKGAAAIAPASVTLLVCWATDALDGPLARRDPRGIRTWIGDRDLEADLTVALGVWIYLTLAGYLSPWLAVAYVLAVAVALWRFDSAQLGWAVQAVPYGLMIWTAWWLAPPYGLALVAFIVLVVVATWPRFPRQTLPEFFAGIRELKERH